MYNIYNKCQNSIIKGVSASSLNGNKLSNVKCDEQEMILNVNNNEMKRNNNINPGNKIKDNDIGNCIKKLAGISQDFIIRGINKITYPIQDKFEWENNPNLYIEKSTTNINDNDGKYTDTINIRNDLERIPPTNDIKNDSIKIFYGPLSLTIKYPSACSFAGTGMILVKEPLLGFMNPGINKIPLLVYNNDANNIEWQLKIHLFVINIFKVDDSNITLTFYYYDYNDKDPTKPWELYSFDESKLDEIKYKCIHQDIQGFDPSYQTPLNSKSNTIGHKVTILTIDTSCFINFLKNYQNNSNNNNNTNYNNTYDERKSNTFDDNTASSINLDGALPYSKKNDISLNRNYNVTINIKEYFIKNNIFDDSNITLTFYYYVYIDNNLTKIWELSVNLFIKSKTFYSSKIIVIKIVLEMVFVNI